MFCPSCGTEITANLPYCNRCGANLSLLTSQPQNVQVSLTKPILIIGIVLTLLTLGGFGGIISGTIEMVKSGAGNMAPAIPIFGMPTILIIDILLIRQLSKLINAALSPGQLQARQPLPQIQSDHSFSRPVTRLEPGRSVTENTTRFLENDYRAPVEPQPGEKQNT